MGHAIGEKYQKKIEECKKHFEQEMAFKEQEVAQAVANQETIQKKMHEEANKVAKVRFGTSFKCWGFGPISFMTS